MGQPVTHTGHDIDAELEDTPEDAVTDMVDRLVDGLEKAMAARPRDAGQVAAALEDMIAACRRDPRVGEQLDLAWQLDELAETYSELGRVDDALETMHAAIAAGFRSTPDLRTRDRLSDRRPRTLGHPAAGIPPGCPARPQPPPRRPQRPRPGLPRPT